MAIYPTGNDSNAEKAGVESISEAVTGVRLVALRPIGSTKSRFVGTDQIPDKEIYEQIQMRDGLLSTETEISDAPTILDELRLMNETLNDIKELLQLQVGESSFN